MVKRILERAGAYLIDYLSVSFLLFVLCSIIMLYIPMYDSEQFYPIAVIAFVYAPWMILPEVFTSPLNSIIFYGPIALICAIIEGIVYSIQERISGKTIGKLAFGMTIEDDRGERPPFYRIFIRNVLKSLSKCLFGIPFFLLCFFNGDTLYDKLTRITVCDVPMPSRTPVADPQPISEEKKRKKRRETVLLIIIVAIVLLLNFSPLIVEMFYELFVYR